MKNDRPTAADLFYEMEADVMRLKCGEVTVREANAISKVRKQQLQLLEAGISLRSLEIDYAELLSEPAQKRRRARKETE